MPPPSSNWSNVSRMATMGWEFVLAVLLIGGLGYLADWLLKTAPWLVVTGLILGTVVGFYRFIRAARDSFKRSEGPTPGPPDRH